MIDRLRLRELFDAAVALPALRRGEFVEQNCRGDGELQRALIELLDCDATSSDPLAAGIAAAASDIEDSAPWIGQRVGNYRILSELGKGGMGHVYLAERADSEYHARVAIKVIRGFPTREALNRLRRERQVLAGLQHPDIARLLDGGSTESGQPYLVMEYVDGVPLGVWLEQQHPSLRARLLLFRRLSLAVHFAHQNMVVHSDLKPSNVMVAENLRPVLLDFGIARLLDHGDRELRATEANAFTPDYASPEQLAGKALTSASDVYALGLLLYELLSGRPRRAQGATATRASLAARTSPQEWLRADAPAIRGDLDRIVERALAEDPLRRYSSAAALTDDIDRYFDGLPLQAGPEEHVYRLRKFVSRHWIGVAFSVFTLCASISFSLWLLSERGKTLRAERQARTEAATANQVTEFLLRLFKDVDPENARGRDLTARELLDRGRERLDSELSDQPQVKARLLTRLAEIYTSIGQPERSMDLLKRAIVALRAPGQDPLVLAFALNELCRAYSDSREYALGRVVCSESLAIRQARLPEQAVELGHSHMASGLIEQGEGNLPAAESHYLTALAIFVAHEDRENIASTRHNLGFLAKERHQFAAARDAYAAALAEKRELFGDAHPKTLNSLQGLAAAEADLGDFAAARADLEKLLDLRVRVHGQNSITVARAHAELASLLQDIGEYSRAEEHYRAAHELFRQLLPADAMDLAVSANNQGTLAESREDYPAAIELFRHSVELRRKKLAPGHLNIARAEHNLARSLLKNGAVAEALPLLESARAARAKLPANHPERFDTELLAAEAERVAGNAAQAEQHMRALTVPNEPGDFRRRGRLAESLGRAFADQRRFAEAGAAVESELLELGKKLDANHPLVAAANARLASYRHALGADQSARIALEQALPILSGALVARAPTLQAAQRLAQELAAGGATGKSPASVQEKPHANRRP